MSPLAVVGMVVGIVAVVAAIQIAIWLPIVRRLHRIPDEMQRDLAGEVIVRGPERASYRGATSTYGAVSGVGVVALTERRLVFRKAVGSEIVVERSDIVGVRTEKRFRGRRVGGREHVVVKTVSGADVGFLFQDQAAWLAALSSASSPARP